MKLNTQIVKELVLDYMKENDIKDDDESLHAIILVPPTTEIDDDLAKFKKGKEYESKTLVEVYMANIDGICATIDIVKARLSRGCIQITLGCPDKPYKHYMYSNIVKNPDGTLHHIPAICEFKRHTIPQVFKSIDNGVDEEQ